MHFLSADELSEALPYQELIESIKNMFLSDVRSPLRTSHDIETPSGTKNSLLIMPAWQVGKSLGIKIVMVCPDNPKRHLETVQASYLLIDAGTGEPKGFLEGTQLTNLRTAAASALAARYLANAESKILLMIGTGTLAPNLIRAHTYEHVISHVLVWGRNRERAKALINQLSNQAYAIEAISDLQSGVEAADIISCATTSTEPLVMGKWLKPGQHVDLVGGYRPDMREIDNEGISKGSVFVDTRTGALAEAGDLTQPIQAGVISPNAVLAELSELIKNTHQGRSSTDELTIFKSVGTALEDLAAAELALMAK